MYFILRFGFNKFTCLLKILEHPHSLYFTGIRKICSDKSDSGKLSKHPAAMCFIFP